MTDISRTINTAGDTTKTIVYVAVGGTAVFIFWKLYKGLNFFEDAGKKAWDWAKKAGKDVGKWTKQAGKDIGKGAKNLTHDLGKSAKHDWNKIKKPFTRHHTKPRPGKPTPKWIDEKIKEKNRLKAANVN